MDAVTGNLSAIEIAGVSFMVASELPVSLRMNGPSYQPFVKGPNAGSIIVHITLEFNGLSNMTGLSEIFRGKGVWTMYADGERFVMSSAVRESDGPIWHMRFDRQLRDVSIYCRQFQAGVPADLPLFPPLDQMLLVYILASNNGALIHSAAVDFRGRSYMFSGRSGAGKSTLSRHFRSAGYEVLSDEKIAVRKIESGFLAFGTPWSGEADIALNKGLPLGGIFFISHGAENIIRKITPAEAAERLMPVTSIPFYDKETMISILSFCEDLVLHVPAYDLCFRPGIEVVDLVEKFISGQ